MVQVIKNRQDYFKVSVSDLEYIFADQMSKNCWQDIEK